MINFGTRSFVPVTLTYTILDEKNLVVDKFDKKLVIDTQKEFIDSISVNTLVKGNYKLIVELSYPGQTEPAVAEKEFRVTSYNVGLINSLIVVVGLMFILILDKYRFKKFFKK